MKPHVKIVEEGEESLKPIDDAIPERIVGVNTIKSILDPATYMAEDRLEQTVKRNKDVVERAQEEDVFPAEIRIPGWFVIGDDELSDEYGNMHDGGTLRIKGLVEDYSEKAYRIIAKRKDDLPGLIYEYEWTFVPKSVVTMIRLVGIDGIEDADNVSKVISAVRDDPRKNWDDKSWKEMLEELEAER